MIEDPLLYLMSAFGVLLVLALVIDLKREVRSPTKLEKRRSIALSRIDLQIATVIRVLSARNSGASQAQIEEFLQSHKIRLDNIVRGEPSPFGVLIGLEGPDPISDKSFHEQMEKYLNQRDTTE